MAHQKVGERELVSSRSNRKKAAEEETGREDGTRAFPLIAALDEK